MSGSPSFVEWRDVRLSNDGAVGIFCGSLLGTAPLFAQVLDVRSGQTTLAAPGNRSET